MGHALCHKGCCDEIDRLKTELEDYKFQTKHSVNIWKSKAERAERQAVKLAEALIKVYQNDVTNHAFIASNIAKEALAEFEKDTK